ncbi:unnamed protein product [Dibothriocephalus latus]|uniref:ubiquitinyl hydrolase 1 n=1 Tax=Dibothriocephalus latus TaxID=60516 RepID=A0A3P7L4Z2_DIBLA|nr:unnamed protein product [Dibothriocephalus latus]
MLGSKGVIAESFAELIKCLWSTGTTEKAIYPCDLKQHDAHDLMMAFLNLLHEDLNKVQQKPYIELKYVNGRPDDDVAEEVWTRYKKRNDSVIIDLFYGMHKLTVVCPVCNYTFRAFDPFASLSLPLDVVPTNAIIFCSIGKLQRSRTYCLIFTEPGDQEIAARFAMAQYYIPVCF